MNKFLIIIIFSLKFTLIFAQNDTTILSQNYITEESLNIKLVYKESWGCLGQEVGKLVIVKKGEKFAFWSLGGGSLKSEKFKGICQEELIKALIALETYTKNSQGTCYGIKGDHCFEIELTINSKSTSYIYKVNKDEKYNAFHKFIDALRQFKEETNK